MKANPVLADTANLPVDYDRRGVRLESVKTHLSSLLPLTVDVERMYEEKLNNKAISLATDKAKMLNTQQVNQRKRQAVLGQIKVMGNKEKKQRGLYHVSKYGVVYDHFLSVHRLWQQYMVDMLGVPFYGAQAEAKLLKCELQGALISITMSKNPEFVGVIGLVIQETQELFKIVCPNNIVKSIPKQGNRFFVDLQFIKNEPPNNTTDTHTNTNTTEEAASSEASSSSNDSTTTTTTMSSSPFASQLRPFEECLAYKLSTLSTGTTTTSASPWYRIPSTHPGLVIYGDKFIVRSAERVVRKFKNKKSVEM